MPLNIGDPWLFDLLAKVVRAGDESELCVLQVGTNYEVWGHGDPKPFEVHDDAGQLIWTETAGV